MASEVLKTHQMSEMVGACTPTVKTWHDAGLCAHLRVPGGVKWHRPLARRPDPTQVFSAAPRSNDVIGVNR